MSREPEVRFFDVPNAAAPGAAHYRVVLFPHSGEEGEHEYVIERKSLDALGDARWDRGPEEFRKIAHILWHALERGPRPDATPARRKVELIADVEELREVLSPFALFASALIGRPGNVPVVVDGNQSIQVSAFREAAKALGLPS